jgi:N-glycosylase/DNA lyase
MLTIHRLTLLVHLTRLEPLLTYTYPAPPKEVFAGDEEVQMTSNTITYHPFPSPERLAQPDVEEKLRELSFGYRAKYISKTAQMLVEKVSETKADDGKTKKYFNVDSYLHSLREMSYEQARTELLQFPGVGPKVAE